MQNPSCQLSCEYLPARYCLLSVTCLSKLLPPSPGYLSVQAATSPNQEKNLLGQAPSPPLPAEGTEDLLDQTCRNLRSKWIQLASTVDAKTQTANADNGGGGMAEAGDMF